jgi:dipeptidyl aminopeptidase/acylaminoacyl peptidase
LDLFSPGFSPDGRLFAWGDVPRGELLRFDPINARFEPWLGGISAEHVDVSHDGQWVAYVTYPDRELWKSRSDGSERRRLTPAGVWAALPRWSPDGRSVAYAGLAPGDDSLAIRRVREDGGGDEVLVRSESRRHLRDVCWLPDGQSLVYSHISWLHPGVFSFDLRTKRASTLPGAEKLTFPKCSRGGDILAFEQDDERPGQRIRRRGRTDWEPVDLPLVYPNWTRDSEAIVGFNPETRHAERFSLKARTRTKVADLTGMPLVGLDGVPWMGLDSTDSPLVLRDLGVRNLYALQLSTDRRR